MDPLDLPKAGIKRRRLYCEHCESYLSKSAYYRHRMRYFDTSHNQWVTSNDTVSRSSDSSDSVIWEERKEVTEQEESVSDSLEQAERRKFHYSVH